MSDTSTFTDGPTKIAFGMKNQTLLWLQDALPWLTNAEEFFGLCEAFPLLKQNTNGPAFVGGIVFNNYRPWDKDIELNIYALPNILNKGVCRAISRYAFGVAGCERISLTIPKSAKPHRTAAEKAGFVREGARRLAWRGSEHAIVYGMLKDDCRWFSQDKWQQEIDNGQKTPRAGSFKSSTKGRSSTANP